MESAWDTHVRSLLADLRMCDGRAENCKRFLQEQKCWWVPFLILTLLSPDSQMPAVVGAVNSPSVFLVPQSCPGTPLWACPIKPPTLVGLPPKQLLSHHILQATPEGSAPMQSDSCLGMERHPHTPACPQFQQPNHLTLPLGAPTDVTEWPVACT